MKASNKHTTSDWPEEIELHVTGIAQGGDGVGRWEGRVVFATGALPGERVRVRLRERQAAFARGDVVSVIDAATERIPSPCPLEERCGAGDWRFITYPAQLRFKATILQEQLQHIGGIDVEVDIPGPHEQLEIGPADDIQAPTWGYRTTAELHFAQGKLGYFAPGSRTVIDIPACCLHHHLINDALAALRPLLAPAVPLRSVTIRCAPAHGQVLAVLNGGGGLAELARRWAKTYRPLVGVLQQNRSGIRRLHGQDHLLQELHGLTWFVGGGSFFQVNDSQTARLITRVLELLSPSPGERLLDLFCGVGTFTLPLAREGALVTGVESYAPAVADGRRSAEINNITTVDWHAGAVEAVLCELRGPFDGAVLDPPRRGCEPVALREIMRLGPRRIVYVACHPGTLARDCKILCEGGYRVERAEVIDLFPHTHHVESIVVLAHESCAPAT